VLQPESARVIIRPFIPGSAALVSAIIGRALALERRRKSSAKLQAVHAEFDSRHFDIETPAREHYAKVRPHILTTGPSRPRAAVAHRRALLRRVRAGVGGAVQSLHRAASRSERRAEGGLRFIMSLRATGEGHISSIEFRTGVIAGSATISIDPVSRFRHRARRRAQPQLSEERFIIKLHEMGFDNDTATAVMEPLKRKVHPQRTQQEHRHVCATRPSPNPAILRRTLECVQWLADSNYELQLLLQARPQRAHHLSRLAQREQRH
jgi:hypothetical protein